MLVDLLDWSFGIVTPWIVLAAAVALALWAWSRTRVDTLALADRAARSGELEPLRVAIQRTAPSGQPTEYHRVIRRLWDGYHRDVAVHLAKDLARAHREAPVAQFWLRQFLQNEPEIAEENLDEDFLAAYFDPAVAAKCGSYG